MMLSLWTGYTEDWTLYHKCTFDGLNKLITINHGFDSISVRSDIYSAWKEWTQVRDHAKFLPAIRTTGGDRIDDTLNTGDVYFLINGWRIYIEDTANIDGVIYSDDYPSPFLNSPTTKLVTNKVSALVQTVSTGSGGSQATPAEIWAYQNRTLTSAPAYNGPTAADIRTEIEVNQTTLATTQGQQDLATSIAAGTLTATQATMLLEMYELLGLDPTKPLVVTGSQRSAGSITQQIVTSQAETIVNRV